MIRSCIKLAAFLLAATASAQPLLTGIVEDVDAQSIEMPSLPGAWQRRVEWMAKEGTQVAVGDVVVRIDPGDLIAREEQSRTDLDKRRLSAARRIDEVSLELMDAEAALALAESAVKLAELDAVIPEATIPRLDYERYQLTLATAKKSQIRAQAQLLNKQDELVDVRAETTLEVQQAESNYARIKAALEATSIRADKSGFIIYADNPFTGQKVFPGETLYSGFNMASIASREDLQVRFWVHEADIRQIQSGQKMTVTADAQGSLPFAAQVTWTSSQAVEKQDWGDGGYFEVLARPAMAVPDGVMPGMSVMGSPVAGQDGS